MSMQAMAVLVCTASSVGLGSGGGSPYDVDPLTDGITTGTLLGLLAISEGLVKPTLPGGLACDPLPGSERCDPATLNALDRTVVGNRSKTWSRVSDAGFFGAAAAAAALSGWDVWRSGSEERWQDLGRDVLVITESAALASALSHVLKLAMRRPRPTQYDERRNIGSVEHQLSFPSGHTSSTAAIAAAYATTHALRHPKSPWRFVVTGAAVAVVALTGYGRVGSGMHFYSDVVAGAALGAGIGVLVPSWHRSSFTEHSPTSDGALRIFAARPGPGSGTAVALSLPF